METTYEVVYGYRKGRKFQDLKAAVLFAKEAARNHLTSGQVVSIWEDSIVVIGIVTDDANSITLHKLTTWPENKG